MEDAKSDAWLEWVNYHLFPLRIASSWAHGGLGGGSLIEWFEDATRGGRAGG